MHEKEKKYVAKFTTLYGVSNIKIDHEETRCAVANWIQLVQDRGQFRVLRNTVIELRVS
jgi:hypothetical protein